VKLSRSFLSGCWLVIGASAALAAATPTPTPRPKLSGGFGRPRSTPAPAAVSEGGQSLADVVRAAQENRGGDGEKEKSGITIDNKTLVKDSAKGRITTSSASAGAPKASAAAPASAAPSPVNTGAATAAANATTTAGNGTPPAEGTTSDPGGEAQWREIARRERKAVEDAKARVGELTATSKKLENDFYAWDDGQYRDRVIKPAWDRAKADLDEARIALEAAEKQLADLPERARKAGALPGWIRE
jgi:hypothetical protein